MLQLLAMLARNLTYEQIIEKLEESISSYKEEKLLGKKDLSKSLNKISMHCHLIILKQSGKDETMEETLKVIRDCEKAASIMDRMNGKEN